MQTREPLLNPDGDQEIEMMQRNARKRVINQKVDMAVGAVDSLTITTIFTMFLTEVMHKFLEETARFVLFPLAGAAAIIRAGLAWRQAKLEGGKNGTLGRAVVETVAGLAIGTAVVGGFVAAAAFSVVSPIIFAATMAAKTLFHLGAACYYWGKSVATSDPQKRDAYRSAARANAVGTVALALATVAVGFVMIAAKPLVAVLGIAAGLISAAFTFYNLFKSPNTAAQAQQAPSDAEESLTHEPRERTNSAQLHKTFSPRQTAEHVGADHRDARRPTDTDAQNNGAYWERRPASPTVAPVISDRAYTAPGLVRRSSNE